MADFVDRDSIVRRIWDDGHMILFVFAGCAAEFALNRAVDWLFFTGKLPADPIGRLFATAGYAQHIVFANDDTAALTLDRIRAAHESVERARGGRIPDWAHRDVLYMLIAYAERAHEALARPLRTNEQEDLYEVFRRVGAGLRIPDLPASYIEWRVDRERHLHRDLARSEATDALYAQYRKHLGAWRYHLLLRIQAMLAPAHVRGLLSLASAPWLRPLVRLYAIVSRRTLRALVQRLVMPSEHLASIRQLDHSARDLQLRRAAPSTHRNPAEQNGEQRKDDSADKRSATAHPSTTQEARDGE